MDFIGPEPVPPPPPPSAAPNSSSSPPSQSLLTSIRQKKKHFPTAKAPVLNPTPSTVLSSTASSSSLSPPVSSSRPSSISSFLPKELFTSLHLLIQFAEPKIVTSACACLYDLVVRANQEDLKIIAAEIATLTFQQFVFVNEKSQMFLLSILVILSPLFADDTSSSSTLSPSSRVPNPIIQDRFIPEIPEVFVVSLYRILGSEKKPQWYRMAAAEVLACLTRMSSLQQVIAKFATLSSVKLIADFGLLALLHRPISMSDLEIKHQIGKGSMGVVYAAKYRNQFVAVKKFDVDSLAFSMDEFLLEVALMNVLDHPNVVNAYGASVHPPDLFIVCKLFQESLSDRLFNYDPLCMTPPSPIPFSLILSISLDIAEGLLYLHESGVIHRDLKPQNILLDELSKAYVCDFGNARFHGHQVTDCVGTVAYTAPEVFSSSKEEGGLLWTTAVDVYSYGMLLWVMTHQRMPYLPSQSGVRMDIAGEVMKGYREPIDPAVVTPELEDLIRKCWDHTPSNRPDFSDVTHILRGLIGQTSDK
jgi:hypothetical protein